MTRPAGLSRGAAAFVAAWVGAAMIAALTGAPAVVALLAAALAAAIAAALSGPLALRRTVIDGIRLPELVTAGEPLTVRVDARTRYPVWLRVEVGGDAVAAGWVADGSTTLEGTAPRRGVHTEATLCWSSAGRMGSLWWQRRSTVTVPALHVAAPPCDPDAPRRHLLDEGDGEDEPAGRRAGHGDPDGVRLWREGDDAATVHWPSSLRARELVVRERRDDRRDVWAVHATSGTADPGVEAGRVRRTIERLLHAGAEVLLVEDDGPPVPIGTATDAARWSAAFDRRAEPSATTPWWRRTVSLADGEPETALTARARWAVAAAAVAPTLMLLGPLGHGPAAAAVVVAAIAAGAATTVRFGAGSRTLRQVLGLFASVVVAAVLVDLGEVDGVIGALRHLMPQLLVTLCVLQGFECVDRRAARVSLACSGLLATYAAGVRIDGRLGAWLLVALAGLALGAREIGRDDRRPARKSSLTTRATTAGAWVAGVAAVVGVLAVVPVPAGPAQLTMPSWLQERRVVAAAGELATSGGSPLVGGPAQGDASRDGGGLGGYPGFSPTMDTALRGDLGDDVVLRVRAAYPDYWRGQTFTRFDGRTWYADEASGVRTEGPDHLIRPSDGDLVGTGGGDFVQTFYAEVDLPNIVFAADRAQRVLLDAPLWQRPDGGLRAEVVLPAGSAYTVVSRRSDATEASLRADGDLAAFSAPARYVELPPSTSPRTLALARELRRATTIDTIRAMEAWLAANVRYELDAPAPDEGQDAVDHFLFESRLGFCEQIATAMAVMLRSIGVPARVATGYVPSERDEVAGVWISRARDAHAWVEVRFPSAGWVAFDPTASVPLAGEATSPTVGGELFAAMVEGVTAHAPQLAGIGLVAVAVTTVVAVVRRWRQRRRRGRWGLLQDRFVAAAVGRGAAPDAANATLAAAFGGGRAAPLAAELAHELDASAFAATWTDDDERYARSLTAMRVLEGTGPTGT